ncbi:homoserine kinase [Aeromicrobium yanjiei]|uniref:homoserine kinase n=1 Tax=Aeromicrobium yanjiei TaxID=2662028 RepID=UPI00312CB3CD
MSFVDGPVTVRVPASSANLGPGFDALGLALTLHDTLTAEVVDAGLDVHVTGEGMDGVPLDETHLVVQAMHAAFDLLGGRPSGLRLTCTNTIPHGRGLGSSAAAIVGGVLLARALVVGGEALLDDAAAYQLTVDLEGHPDNVAAAFFGGLTIAWIDGAAAEVERLETDVEVTVFVPPAAVSTEKARGLLPRASRTPMPRATPAAPPCSWPPSPGRRTASRRRPRTGSTRATAPRRCPSPTSCCASCGSRAYRRSSRAPARRSWCSREEWPTALPPGGSSTSWASIARAQRSSAAAPEQLNRSGIPADPLMLWWMSRSRVHLPDSDSK